MKKKLDNLTNRNKKENENYSTIYSSLIPIKKKVNNSKKYYKEFKDVLEKIKDIKISVEFNEKDILNLIKINSTELSKEKLVEKKEDSIKSDNSLFNSEKKSTSKEKSEVMDESALLMDENLNGLPTERLDTKIEVQILDETLKVKPEENTSFIKFKNSHKIKNFSPIRKKKNFIKVNSMMNFNTNSYSSVKKQKKMKRRISKASINLKKTNILDDEIEINTDMLQNDIYSKSKKEPKNYHTIYSKIQSGKRNERSRKKKLRRKTLVLPNKSNMSSLSRRPSQNRDRNVFLKTHYNNFGSKSDYIGQKIDEDLFHSIIRKEISKKSQRVNFNSNHFLCDVIEELKIIIEQPLPHIFMVDLRRNNIEFSSRIDEDIEDFKNFNVKIII